VCAKETVQALVCVCCNISAVSLCGFYLQQSSAFEYASDLMSCAKYMRGNKKNKNGHEFENRPTEFEQSNVPSKLAQDSIQAQEFKT
jgi:hypothetical protein